MLDEDETGTYFDPGSKATRNEEMRTPLPCKLTPLGLREPSLALREPGFSSSLKRLYAGFLSRYFCLYPPASMYRNAARF
jgi:hypothetical protein